MGGHKTRLTHFGVNHLRVFLRVGTVDPGYGIREVGDGGIFERRTSFWLTNTPTWKGDTHKRECIRTPGRLHPKG